MDLYDEFIEQININSGDRILIASGIKKLATVFKEKGTNLNLNILINRLQKAVGKHGTIMFPTYNWEFCNGKNFDYLKSESQTGVLSQIALERSDFIRTKHPIYSFAVWGKDQKELVQMDNISSFGIDSPFEFIREKKYKMLIIDVSFTNSFTFLHSIEERVGITYRYLKEFKGIYIDKYGKESLRTYTMYVRDLELNFKNDLDKFEILCEQLNCMRRVAFYKSEIKIVYLYDTVRLIEDEIINNNSNNLIKYNTKVI